MRARAPTVLVALALALGYLIAPPMGTDLSAQVARARFISGYGLTPVDFGWYGGTVQYGYSLVSPAVMALIGVRVTGALALVVSALAFPVLLARTGAPRPLLGGVIGAVCIAGNLVSGRVTYALGVAFGLLALVALTAGRRWVRLVFGAAGAVLAGATSPVAGLFLGLAGVALLARDGPPERRPGGRPQDRHNFPEPVASRPRFGHNFREVVPILVVPEAVTIIVAAAVPLGVTAVLFGEGGWMNISASDTIHAVVASLAVALMVARPPIRAGALLSAAGVVAAFLVHTPVGLNATRLATMFALPVVAAYATPKLRWWGLTAALVALALWQPPVLVGDLRDAGNPTASESYFAPLRAEVQKRAPVGRIEVPPTRDYWEAAYATPLARGWLRQVDLSRNALFFDGVLTADEYRSWLTDNGVSYVALADAQPSWVGQREVTLIRGGLPYLTEVWRGEHWTLYEVAGKPSIVDGATLVSETGDAVTVEVGEPGTAHLRVRWSRWLAVQGPAGASLRPDGRWTAVRTTTPGRYTISSSVVSPG
jgi:hypothetical protein